MFCRICVPRPSWNLPPEINDRSHAEYAAARGLRTNASATEVRTMSRSVACRPEFHKLTSFLAASLGSLQVTSLSMWRAGH